MAGLRDLIGAFAYGAQRPRQGVPVHGDEDLNRSLPSHVLQQFGMEIPGLSGLVPSQEVPEIPESVFAQPQPEMTQGYDPATGIPGRPQPEGGVEHPAIARYRQMVQDGKLSGAAAAKLARAAMQAEKGAFQGNRINPRASSDAFPGGGPVGGPPRMTYRDLPALIAGAQAESLRKGQGGFGVKQYRDYDSEAQKKLEAAIARGEFGVEGQRILAEAMKYRADKGLEGTEYRADKGLEGTKYTADQRLAGVKYEADRRLEAANAEMEAALRKAAASGRGNDPELKKRIEMVRARKVKLDAQARVLGSTTSIADSAVKDEAVRGMAQAAIDLEIATKELADYHAAIPDAGPAPAPAPGPSGKKVPTAPPQPWEQRYDPAKGETPPPGLDEMAEVVEAPASAAKGAPSNIKAADFQTGTDRPGMSGPIAARALELKKANPTWKGTDIHAQLVKEGLIKPPKKKTK